MVHSMKQLLLLLIFVFSSHSYANKCPELSQELDTFIKNHNEELRGGENCKHRTTYKDEKIELVAYTILSPCFDDINFRPASCGNRYYIFLTGLSSQKIFEPIQIGGKGIFHPEKIEMKNNIIIVLGKGYGSTDPTCCPTQEKERMVLINNGALELMHHNQQLKDQDAASGAL